MRVYVRFHKWLLLVISKWKIASCYYIQNLCWHNLKNVILGYRSCERSWKPANIALYISGNNVLDLLLVTTNFYTAFVIFLVKLPLRKYVFEQIEIFAMRKFLVTIRLSFCVASCKYLFPQYQSPLFWRPNSVFWTHCVYLPFLANIPQTPLFGSQKRV